eukprot:13509-Pyramimonas_sp.AAC.1
MATQRRLRSWSFRTALILHRSSSGTSEGTDSMCGGISQQLPGRVGSPKGHYSKRRRAVHHCSWGGVSPGAQHAVRGYSHADFIAEIIARVTREQRLGGGIGEGHRGPGEGASTCSSKEVYVVAKGDSAILSWIVKQVTFAQNSFQYKRNGRAAYEDLKMVKYRSPLLNFAEDVLAKKSGVPRDRLTSAWLAGVWLGRSTDADERIVGAALGIVMARAVKKRPEELQWDKGAFDKMVFPMWSQTDLKD